jgi:aryl sulfotransferase
MAPMRSVGGNQTMLIREAARHVRDHLSDSRQWDAYRPRPGDIVIGTAAKVGTTWTQRIVSLLVFQTPEVIAPLGAQSPWLDCRFQIPVDMISPLLEAQQHRRFIKTHLAMDAIPVFDEVRYIHTARDGRDAAMSFLNHFNSHTSQAWARFDAIGMGDPQIGEPYPRPPREAAAFFRWWLERSGEHCAQGFFHLENSYWAERRRPNVLLVHYNDLKADLDGEMRRISAFLDIPVNEAAWPSLVEAATFEAMKRDGDALLAGLDMAFEGGHRSFLHRATNQRWRGAYDEAELQRYEAMIAQALPSGLIAWLEGGRAAAGDPREAAD